LKFWLTDISAENMGRMHILQMTTTEKVWLR